MLDVALRRYPGRKTYIVCPVALGALFQLATRDYPNVQILIDGIGQRGTGGAIQYALEQLILEDLVDFVYGDAFFPFVNVLASLFGQNHENLRTSDAVLSTILLEPRIFNPQLGYCRLDPYISSRIIHFEGTISLTYGIISVILPVIDLNCSYLETLCDSTPTFGVPA